ncbi:EF-1 guanine nucleotide exchange domain-containing protein [Colletotrichum abscissum]|uniref:DNA replication complex GINS protein PSF1 n=1 Tax=Colletotrichum abscissum TaxID=1671311 RepID=A0A9P9X9G4_9PEZI|nr:EF-1 guanine nucleotide exchange domain-containing protein [Colletotrichum abscissum]
MGFADLLTDAGAAMLNSWLTTRSYIVGSTPSQADVATFKALQSAPDAEKYPHAARWYKHIASYESDFATLPGDASKSYSVYGPEATELPVNPAKAPAAEEDEDDVDLFGSDDEEEDAEAARIREERLAEYKKKKDNKPKLAAKSVVTMDVKPWDDETDMAALEAGVRAIEHDGLVWGASKLVPVGFGIKKLQINLVVEDEKISLSDLEEEIAELEDYVQSVDIAAMQKLILTRKVMAQETQQFLAPTKAASFVAQRLQTYNANVDTRRASRSNTTSSHSLAQAEVLFVNMYGDLGNKLVQHAKRTQNLSHLPAYQAEIVRAVTREVRDLEKDVTEVLEPFQGSFDPAANQATACTVLVNYLSMRRNKRCVLAYHRTRTDKLEELAWKGVDVLDLAGQQVRGNAGSSTGGPNGNADGPTSSLSPQEEEYVRQYGDLLAAYKGQWTDIDLTGSLEPPRDLFIDVRVLKDAGEIQTEYGAINLTKNSQFYVRQGDRPRPGWLTSESQDNDIKRNVSSFLPFLEICGAQVQGGAPLPAK